MRITVRRVVELIGVYANGEELLRDYPHPEAGDLRQALNFALAHLDGTIDLYLDAACVFCRIRVSRLKPHAWRLEMGCGPCARTGYESFIRCGDSPPCDR